MNKNNFLHKFVFFYKKNLEGLTEDASYIFEFFIDFVKDTYFDFIHLLVRIISIFVPVVPAILSVCSEYLDKITAKKESERLGIRLSGEGYYLKKQLREKMAKRYQEKKREFFDRRKSRIQNSE
jgi:hypothetical protein